jgi:hypothetical protein
MFELHVIIAGIVMFNILKLIIKIMPNYYPTECRAEEPFCFLLNHEVHGAGGWLAHVNSPGLRILERRHCLDHAAIL